MITWLASYPKSGSTWARAFLAAYLADGLEDPLAFRMEGFMYDGTPELWREVTGVQDLHTIEETAFHAQRGRVLVHMMRKHGVKWVKTHTPRITLDGLEMIPDAISLEAVYIVRDPRDVAVSFADHFGSSIDETIATMGNRRTSLRFQGRCEFLSSWSLHVGSWRRGAEFPVRVVRYEDMHAYPEWALANVVAAFGEAPDRARVQRAIEASSFNRLRAGEDARGFVERSVNQERFFRRGVAGGWRDVLTSEQAQRIVDDHGEIMGSLGYDGC